MTDSTTRLREALSQIAADHTDDAPDPATLDAIWRAGRRRRWRARAGVVATLGVVALLVLGAFVPWGVPTVAVPATPPGVPPGELPGTRGHAVAAARDLQPRTDFPGRARNAGGPCGGVCHRAGRVGVVRLPG